MTLPIISLGKLIEKFVDWLNVNLYAPFEITSTIMDVSVARIEKLLLFPPAWLMTVIFGLIAWKFAGKGTAIFTVLGLIFCMLMNLWNQTMLTTALVAVSTLTALLIAVPLGIVAGLNKTADQIARPILDFMQTMPPWVYLIPAVILFSLGRSPAIIATAVFAIPPPLRLTNLGIRKVPPDQLEVGRAFGANAMQILFKIQLPAALPTIIAGVSQCIMMALAMVVLAGLIGAGGLGGEVVRGLTRMQLGVGARSGLAIVILAIIFERVSLGAIDLFQKGAQKK
jgi:glycine betaine/proline transport system permease protein